MAKLFLSNRYDIRRSTVSLLLQHLAVTPSMFTLPLLQRNADGELALWELLMYGKLPPKNMAVGGTSAPVRVYGRRIVCTLLHASMEVQTNWGCGLVGYLHV